MKKTFAVSLFLFASIAQAGIPYIWNNGRTFTFEYWNSSNRDETCYGPVYLKMEDGSKDTVMVREWVNAHRSGHRQYWTNIPGVSIKTIAHNVWCR